MKLPSAPPCIPGNNRKNQSIRLLVILLLAAASSPVWARYNPPAACNNPFSPQQEVTEGSKVAAQVYQQMPVLPDNDPVSIYVAQLGSHLVQHAPGIKWPFSFHVVASPDINAFALPGGAIFVNLGTVQAAETEAQLAGVMAHETSHVILRHATCNMKKQQTKGIEYGLGSILSQILLGNGAAGQIAQAGISGLQGLSFLKMSRDDENQADLLGTDILYDTGYDPRALPQFFETIQAKYGAGGAQILSDHPNPGNRVQAVNAEIAALPPRSNPIVSSAAFQRVHSIALQERTFNAQQTKEGQWKNGNYASGPGRVYNSSTGSYGGNGQQGNNGQYGQNRNGQGGNGQGPDQNGRYPNDNGQYPDQNGNYPNQAGQYPNGGQSANYPNNGQQGQPGNYPNNGQQGNSGQYGADGPVALSRTQLGITSRQVSYRGPNFSLNRPGTWQAGSDQSGAVILSPQGGSGTFGIVYGVMIDTLKAPGNGITDADSLASATGNLAQQISQQNGGLQQLGQIVPLNVNGQGANALELRGRSPLVQNGRTVPEHDWLITIARPDGDLNYMVFVCPEASFVTLKPLFTTMIRSFRAQ